MKTKSSGKKKAAAANHDHVVHLLRSMIRIRRLEDKCAELYTTTKIRGFMHLYEGEEAIAVGVKEALDQFVSSGLVPASSDARKK